MSISNKYPPKFDKNLLYPAEYNLENLDIPSELSFINRTTGQQDIIAWGEKPLGEYFNIYFPPSGNSGIPVLSYGKHYFLLSFTPVAPNINSPRLKAGSKIQFEFKDAEDSTGNRRVIFSDLTPYKGLSNYFIGYVWIKEDPIRTYENIIGGQGTLNIVGEVETTNPNWMGKPNVRTSVPISIDLTGTNPNLGYSPILFQNTTSSLSQGVNIYEEQGTDRNNPSQSYAVISASKLDTYSGELKFVNVSCLVSSSVVDGDDEYKPLQVHNMKTGDNIIYENNIHPDYSTGISPISEKWKIHIPENILARGPHDPDGDGVDEYEKIKFRLTYANSANSIAQDLFNSESIDFQVDYPTGSNNWLEWTGSSKNNTGTTLLMGTQVIGQNLQDGVYMTSGQDRDGNKTVNFDLYKSGVKQKNVMSIGDNVETNADTNRHSKTTSSFAMGSISASISSSKNASILGGAATDIRFSDFSSTMGTSGSLIESGAKSSIVGGHGNTISVGSSTVNEANMILAGQGNSVLGTGASSLVYQSQILGGQSNKINVGDNQVNISTTIIGGNTNTIFGGQSNVILSSHTSEIAGNGLGGNSVMSSIISSRDVNIDGTPFTIALGIDGPFTASQANTTYVNHLEVLGNMNVNSITSSIVSASIIYSSGSNIFGDEDTDTHQFIGNITASGFISASGYISATGHITGSNISASGNLIGSTGSFDRILVDGEISASGNVFGHNLWLDKSEGNYLFSSNGTVGLSIISGSALNDDMIMQYDKKKSISWGIPTHTGKDIEGQPGFFVNLPISASSTIHAESHITSSGNISASGNVITNQITASGDISSSGTVEAGGMLVDLDIAHKGDSNTKIRFTDDNISLTAGGNVVEIESTGMNVNGHITASGNISASGFLHYIGGVTKADAMVINEEGETDHDFRVEGGNNAYLIYSDASEDKVSIGRNVPSRGVAKSILHVNNDITVGTHITMSTGNISGSTTSKLNIGGAINTLSHITASGNISASGTLTVGSFTLDNLTTGNITASGDISSSGKLTVGDPDGAHISASNGNLQISGGYAWIKSDDVGGETKLYLSSNVSNGGKLFYISAEDASKDQMEFNIGRYTHKWEFKGGGDTNGEHTAFEIYGQDASANQDYSRLRLFDPDSTIRAQIHTSGSVYFNPIGPDANFGIGTNAPSNKLEVAGDISQSGNFITEGHITASGNISASGNIIGELTGKDGAVTGITSIYNTALKIGRDSTDLIDFASDDQIRFKAGNSNEMVLTTSELYPGTNNGSALGKGSNAWSDLFLASGGVINFNNGDITLTHSATSQHLKLAGGSFNVDGHITASGNYSGSSTSTIDIGGRITANDIFAAGASSNFLSLNVGSGYGATGVTISSAGAIQMNNKLTVDGDISGSTTTNIGIGGHITASGNISASGGTIIAQSASFGDGDKMLIHADGTNSEIVARNNHFLLRTNRTQDKLKFQPNNTDVMIISASGNVGIGTTSPLFTSGKGLMISDSTQANLRLADGSDYVDVANSAGDLYIINRKSTGDLKFRVDSSTEAMTISSSGNIGIGNTGPTEPLVVNGNISASGNLLLEGGITSSTDIVMDRYDDVALRWVDGSGATTNNFIDYRRWHTSATGGKEITNTTGIIKIESKNESNGLVVSHSAVGIGTSTPSNTLDIHGSLVVSSSTAGHITASGNISGSATTTSSLASVYWGFNEGELSGSGDFTAPIHYFRGNKNDDYILYNLLYDNLYFQSQDILLKASNGVGVKLAINENPVSALDVNGDINTNSHITASGNISASGDIIGNHYAQTFHHWDQNNGTTGTNENYIPGQGTTSEGTSTLYYRQWIAPFDGSLEKIRLYAESAAGNSVFKLYVNSIIATGATSTSDTVSVSATTTANFTFSSNNTFSAGDIIRVTFDPTNLPNSCNGTLIWKYNTTTL